ncbi:hypothetical protein [Aestuariivita boseongensis]|uniref:hypothetical protein n=1 Tax=Aestuariivita boseongensis TaxID=1470562 RepID=UPI00067FCBCA|nr:hypothetical protein [Aestuariivita boseongensis]
MLIIVPLAGPDFILPDGTVKATQTFCNGHLLHKILNSRPWATRVRSEKYVFVLIDRRETRSFASSYLEAWFPGAKVVFLSAITRGSAVSALGGMTAYASAEEPVIVDLADIQYSSDLDPEALFAQEENCGGVALTFDSANPVYSYLRCDADGTFVEAAEKRVISKNASAGTYIFSGASVFLRAIAHAMENEATQTYNGLFFVCPLFNGVRAQGKTVSLSQVRDVIDVKVT